MALLQALSIEARARWTSSLRAIRTHALRCTLAASALCVPVHAQSTNPADVGSWFSWDWECDTANLVPVNGERVRMFHGALIPHGPYRGCVLTWGKYQNGTETFLWNPNNPDRLFHLANSWGGAPRHVDAASMAWDDEGQLVIVSAQHPSPAGTPSGLGSTWRLFPAALQFPPTVNLPSTPPGPPNPCFAEVGGNAWRALQNMSIHRFRPALFTMANGLIPSSALGKSVLTLGGGVFPGFQPTSNSGLEFWQALSPRSTPGGSTWSSTFVPNVPPLNPNSLPPGAPTETYVLQNGLTESQVESAPCSLQMANSGQGVGIFTKGSFVAQDSLVAYATPPAPSSHAVGLSTVVRPRYAANPSTWELWPRGSGGDTTYRSQGSAVLRHDLAGATGYSGKNRVFSLGGAYYSPSSNSWGTTPRVHEYRTTTAQNLSAGQWYHHVLQGSGTFPLGRIDNSAVLLPTGDILVIGGGRLSAAQLGAPGAPATTDQVSLQATPEPNPQILRPGLQGTTASGVPPLLGPWSVAAMSTPPNSPFYGAGGVPRGHGHSAVLLPDGRVLVSGGLTVLYPGQSFTGDIFSPPYLYYGFRPHLDSLTVASFDFGDPITLAVGRGPEEVIDAVVLLRPASTCYGFDSSQRYIELGFTVGSYDAMTGIQSVSATAPSDQLGPTGHYLLYVVSHLAGAPERRVPSMGQFLYLK